MILLPAIIGGALAAGTAWVLFRLGLLRRAGIVGLILIAIAGFWPLFAVASGDDTQLMAHLAMFAAFGTVALFSHRVGLAGLALALIAHGVLDCILFTTAHVGPLWWPAFCAAYDVTFGAALLITIRKPIQP